MKPLRLFRRAGLDMAAGGGLEIVLYADRPLRLVYACGRRIRCTAGCVWLTAAGRRDDIFLHVGEFWTIDTDELVLLEAVSRATIALGA